MYWPLAPGGLAEDGDVGARGPVERQQGDGDADDQPREGADADHRPARAFASSRNARHAAGHVVELALGVVVQDQQPQPGRDGPPANASMGMSPLELPMTRSEGMR
jgi:hypothetical protein